jgi:hypothetical protein
MIMDEMYMMRAVCIICVYRREEKQRRGGVEKDYSMYSTGRIPREVEWYTHSSPPKNYFHHQNQNSFSSSGLVIAILSCIRSSTLAFL